MKLQCNVCETKIEIPEKSKQGSRVTCPGCFAQLAIYKHGKDFFLGCAMCKEELFEPTNCGKCERNREKKAILEEGLL